MLENLRLDGRAAVVTGSGRGLGRAMAKALAQAGASVVVASRTQAQVDETVSFFQLNRNPFIDHPEWVRCLWAEACGIFADGFESGDTAAWQ